MFTELWNDVSFWRTLVFIGLGFSLVGAIYLRYKFVEKTNLASTDHMTGLANRRVFESVWEYNLAMARRDGRAVVLLAIDVDNLKYVNDNFGHGAGDRVISSVAMTISDALARETDLAARLGGDEFAAILYSTSVEGGLAVAKSIVSSVRALPQDECHNVTVSIGVLAYSPTPGVDTCSADLFREADKAMYRAKKAGGDRAYLVTEGLPPKKGEERL